MATKLYVGNLPFQTTSDELKDHFAQAGSVESASVVEDRMTGRSRGFGFVEMATPEEAAAAIEQLNGKDFAGWAAPAPRRQTLCGVAGGFEVARTAGRFRPRGCRNGRDDPGTVRRIHQD